MKKCDIYVNSLLMFRNVRIANHFFSRLKGLMGQTGFKGYSGLLISPCNQIHTFFMKMKIDAVFIDRSMTVVKAIENADKGRIYPMIHKADSVLELESGLVKKYGIRAGDKLKLEMRSLPTQK